MSIKPPKFQSLTYFDQSHRIFKLTSIIFNQKWLFSHKYFKTPKLIEFFVSLIMNSIYRNPDFIVKTHSSINLLLIFYTFLASLLFYHIPSFQALKFYHFVLQKTSSRNVWLHASLPTFFHILSRHPASSTVKLHSFHRNNIVCPKSWFVPSSRRLF